MTDRYNQEERGSRCGGCGRKESQASFHFWVCSMALEKRVPLGSFGCEMESKVLGPFPSLNHVISSLDWVL